MILHEGTVTTMTENELFGNSELMDDTISRQGVLRLLNAVPSEEFATKAMLISGVNALPSAQPEIIRCNSCKHWTQSTGKMKGYGLGRCDFHDADLVACNGFCYWAERRTDEQIW